MLPSHKRVRDAPTLEDVPSTFKADESLAVVAARVLPATSETVEQTIPLLVTRITHHDEAIDQEIVTLRARVGTLEQHDELVVDLQDAQVTDILEITELHRRVEDAETRLEQSHIRKTSDRARLQSTEMTLQDVESLHARVEESRKADRLEKIPPKRNGMNTAAIEQLIAQRVIEALAAQETNRNNGNHPNG
ncbi:hypothetical protein Tco_1262089 [Tanacetum coccineum]